MVLPKSGLGGPGLQRLLLGTIAVVHPGPLQAINHGIYRNLVHLGPGKDMDLHRPHRNPRKVRGICRAPVNDNGLLEALLRTGRLRGPSSLGSLVMLESFGLASRYQLSVRTIR